MNTKNIIKNIVTLGPIGHWRGSGTWATIATLPLALWIGSWELSFESFLIFSIAVLFLFFSVHVALPLFKDPDPSAIVADEVIGCLITFYWGIPLTATTIVLGVILFRFFDIVKPLGISTVERVPGVLGIVLDDLLAGAYAHLLLKIAVWFVS